MGRGLAICSCLMVLFIMAPDSYGQAEQTPLQFLRGQEVKLKDTKGEVCLGKALTITYPAYDVDSDEIYHPFFLELSDILKSPLRKNYRIIVKGYSDNTGSALENLGLSVKRAESLKKLLIKKYYMKEKRITTQGHGEADPVASNKTAEDRKLNRRVEIHIYGDVSEAVRFIERQGETR